MKSIQNEVIKNIEINKSKFINYLMPVRSVEDVKLYLKMLRDKHPDANHHCYAYIIGETQNIQKFSDDGEPSKTAGMPMLEVLKKNDLTDVIIVSVRYFGGVKLGAGGLVRAYTKACSECVKDSDRAILKSFTILKFTVSFDQIGVCEKHLRDHYVLLNTEYDSLVHYTVEVLSEHVINIQNEIIEKTSGTSISSVISTSKRYE